MDHSLFQRCPPNASPAQRNAHPFHCSGEKSAAGCIFQRPGGRVESQDGGSIGIGLISDLIQGRHIRGMRVEDARNRHVDSAKRNQPHQLPGVFFKQAGIFHRTRHLMGKDLHDFRVPRAEKTGLAAVEVQGAENPPPADQRN
jgi:hypothetical protein